MKPYVITEQEFIEAAKRSDRGEPEPRSIPEPNSGAVACAVCGCRGSMDCGHAPMDTERCCTLDSAEVCPCCRVKADPGNAVRIVDEVLKELRGRKGFNHWFDSIDEEIQNELLFTLIEKVENIITPNAKSKP